MRLVLIFICLFIVAFSGQCQEDSSSAINMKTETLSIEWAATRSIFKGIDYNLSEKALISLFGEPYEFHIIKNCHFYFYCKSDSERHYFMPVWIENGKIRDYDISYKALEDNVDCDAYSIEFLEEFKRKISLDEFNRKMGKDDKITIALFESESKSPTIVVDKYQIEEIVKYLNDYSEDFSIIGHTHNQGSKSNNLQLSIERAQTVIFILEQEYGLEKDLIKAKGEGEENPIYDNDSQANRKLNSRVEFKISG